MSTIATQLEDFFDPATLPAGTYVVSSRSPAHVSALDALDAGIAKLVGERDTDDGELLRVFQVDGSRTNPEPEMLEEAHTVRLGPEFFQAPLKEYAEWQVKWWREVVQNGVDAGATEMVLLAREEEDGNWTIAAQDNGKGMDKTTLVDKFLVLGGTTKVGAAGKTGGFGKAKELIILPWLSWRIATNDLEANGQGASYKLSKIAFSPGVQVEAVMPGANHTTLQAAREFLQRSYIPQCSFSLVTASGEVELAQANASTDGWRVLEDTDQYTVYFEEREDGEREYYAWVRSNGLFMFTLYVGEIPGRMVIELKGPSIELLTSNRDGFRDRTLSRHLSEFAERLAKDTKSALREKSGHVRKKYSTGKKYMAEIVVPYDVKTEKSSTGREDVLTTEGVIEIVNQMKELAVQTGEEGLSERADLAQSLLTELPFNGDRGLEAALKQLSWEPDFVLVSEVDNFRVPKKFTPEHMTTRVKRFAQVWAETCRWVLMQLGCGKPYSIGFIFTPDSAAAYLYENGEHWLLINPFRGREAVETLKRIHRGYDEPSAAESLESFQVTDREDFKLVYAMAVHECTHFADEVSYHDEAFASALTYNMAKCADGMGQYRKILGATSERKMK